MMMLQRELCLLSFVVAVVYGVQHEIGHPCPECYMFNIQQRMRNEVKTSNTKVSTLHIRYLYINAFLYFVHVCTDCVKPMYTQHVYVLV